MPAPRWRLTAWLLSPSRDLGPEADRELRQTLLRRVDAVLVSAVFSLWLSTVAAVQHPQRSFALWLTLEVALAIVRVPVAVCMMRFARKASPRRALPPWITDAFVCTGTLWSALLGLGTFLCLSTSDPGLSIMASIVALGTIGVQGNRNPGSPRLNCVQMASIVLPLSAGTLFSTVPLVRWTAVLSPIYLIGMINLTRQLHRDYVALLLAQIQDRARALHCPLTKLPNRAHFDEALAAALDGAVADGRCILMMYVDLDGFKAVNDEFGHAAGDAVLIEVAGRLRAWGRSRNWVARLGGDEFAILLSSDDRHDAAIDALALIDSVRRPYALGLGRVARIGATIGLASSAAGMSPSTLVAQADAALYAAKRSGKGDFRWFDTIAPVAEVPAQAAA